jgi:preprotein translocase subunit SecA
MANFLQSLFSSNEREVKRLLRIVAQINAEGEKLQDFRLEEGPARRDRLRQRLAAGETLEEILPEAFALVREVADRTIHLRHYDVQCLGGIVLHEGKIAEMKTGEGKTLVATLPAYLNSLEGKGVHIVTVNDYLAKRDREWMGPVYEALGLRCGQIRHDSSYQERREAYSADITFGTNNEYGFDYLRDNMAISLEQTVQRPLHYAIVDEVDSILVDEARTPLIISGPAEESTELYYKAAQLVRRLIEEEDFTTDEKARTAALTEEGGHKAERYFGLDNLYSSQNVEYHRHISVALRALHLFKNEVDYIMKDGEVIIVDEFTGRMMFGRRYSDGLHQAIEAKEGLRVRQENQTLATITFQNYFRMYKKLAGMTGTAVTEEEELRAIYRLPVVVIPTNKPMIRTDSADVIYKTEKAKFNAITEEIGNLYSKARPVLVGTRSIEKSETVSRLLAKKGIPHQVLNAKYHEKEAEIISLAGQKHAVTIATNMAGRGVDIILGDGVTQLEGLHIIGTERHEARRIDNQLRGRSGRQGDPGSSRFYLSLEDELLRLFGGETISNLMERLKVPEDMPIENGLLSRAIENAQKKVEGRNFDIRKDLLEYDDVLNTQRETIYSQRRKLLENEDLSDQVREMMSGAIQEAGNLHLNEHMSSDQWDVDGFWKAVAQLIGQSLKPPEDQTRREMVDWATERALELYAAKEAEVGSEMMRQVERYVFLRVVDSKWKDQLYNLDYLKEGIGLRAYGQKSPLLEYQLESYQMFQAMLASIREDAVKFLFRAQLQPQAAPLTPAPQRSNGPAALRHVASNRPHSALSLGERVGVRAQSAPAMAASGKPLPNPQGSALDLNKVGRNDLCPCGSGKKFKKCHGKDQ